MEALAVIVILVLLLIGVTCIPISLLSLMQRNYTETFVLVITSVAIFVGLSLFLDHETDGYGLLVILYLIAGVGTTAFAAILSLLWVGERLSTRLKEARKS